MLLAPVFRRMKGWKTLRKILSNWAVHRCSAQSAFQGLMGRDAALLAQEVLKRAELTRVHSRQFRTLRQPEEGAVRVPEGQAPQAIIHQ